MGEWIPVLIAALVVVCVTTWLLLDPRFKPPTGNDLDYRHRR
jgi:hypothetical protein